MGMFSLLSGIFSGSSSGDSMHDTNSSMPSTNNLLEQESLSSLGSSWGSDAINPASGLPMIDGTGGIDVGGNIFGTDFDHHDTFSSIDTSLGNGSGLGDW